MKPLDARTIADVTGGSLLAGDPERRADSVSTDTRSLRPGALFLALRGERCDANEFAPAAVGAGAAVAVVERWTGGELPTSAAVVEVADGLLALQKLAAWYRCQFDMPVVGITGSNGKTSTKDFTRAVLEEKFRVGATEGNLNNHIGVPLTVLSLEAGCEAAVIEMGMNHAGEIEPLCEIARPNLGIITNIGTAHIEHLGSRDGIAEEKGALARSLPEDGTLFVPAGCDYYGYFRSRCRARVVPVGNGRGLIRAEDLRYDGARTHFTLVIENRAAGEVALAALGRHMVKNALLAAGCGWALGLSAEAIVGGLANATVTGGRLRRYESGGVSVLDDTYNANPESMAAALESLAELPLANGARRHAVLGPMGELGGHAADAHRRLGELAAELGLAVTAIGPGAEGIAAGAGDAEHFADPATAARELRRRIAPGDVVLFKASRSAALERVMNQVFPPPN